MASILFLLVLSPRANAQTAQAWNAFAPTFTAKYTVSTFTPDIAISVSRIQVQVIPPLLPLPGCKSDPVVEISGGATVHTLTLTGAANDSGPIALSYAAGVPIALSVSTASPCLTWATGANIVIQYDTSALSGEVTSLENQIASLQAQLTTCETGGGTGGGGLSYHLPPSSKLRAKAPRLMRTSTAIKPAQRPQVDSPDLRKALLSPQPSISKIG